jgi:hypothetical protein
MKGEHLMRGGSCVPGGLLWAYLCSVFGLGGATGDEYIIAGGSLVFCGFALWLNWRFLSSKKGQVVGAVGWFLLPLSIWLIHIAQS